MSVRKRLTVRPDLAELAPYTSEQRPARFRMNTNESPYPPPEAVVEAMVRAVRESQLNRYPDREATDIREALARHLGWPSTGLWVANGSNEVFLHLFLAFGGPGRRALVFTPTYSLHEIIPRITGTEVARARRGDDFEVDLAAAVDAIERAAPHIVILCSPNNPTGNCESPATVQALVEATPGLVVVDEAYVEFAGKDDSVAGLLQENSNLLVTRTFSKAWRLAGLRLGYMLGSPDVVSDIARVRLPYHLDAITQQAGTAALDHFEDAREVIDAIVEERERISVGLHSMGVKAYPSRANFVLFQVDDPEHVWNRLLVDGILIRNYLGIPGLENCLRVTAGMPEETEAFLAAMKDTIDE